MENVKSTECAEPWCRDGSIENGNYGIAGLRMHVFVLCMCVVCMWCIYGMALMFHIHIYIAGNQNLFTYFESRDVLNDNTS